MRPTAGPLALRLETSHFRHYADAVPDTTLRELAAALEDRLPGYTIGELVVWRGGSEALGRLVVSNGNTAAALGLPPTAFEEEWFAFVREKYLASSADVPPPARDAQ